MSKHNLNLHKTANYENECNIDYTENAKTWLSSHLLRKINEFNSNT